MLLRIVNFNYFLTAVNANCFLYNRLNYVVKVNHYSTTFWVVKKQLRALYNRPQMCVDGFRNSILPLI